MEFKINEEQLQNAINAVAQEKIKDMVGSYEVKNSIEKAVNQTFENILMRATVECEKTIDIAPLADMLAKEIARNAVAASITLMQEMFFDSILKLKGISQYDKETFRKEKELLDIRYKRELEARK